MGQTFLSAINTLPPWLKEILRQIPQSVAANVREVRLRVNRPITMDTGAELYFLTPHGEVTTLMRTGLLVTDKRQIGDCFLSLCGYSLHSYSDQIANGFLTIQGGHRVGLCGSAVCERERIRTIAEISGLNIRIARQILGVAHKFAQSRFQYGVRACLIVGEPGSGKTTFVRDLIRCLANGSLGTFYKVCVVDERAEIAAVHQGQPQHDIGISCDVLDGYPKHIGISIATRTLSPEVIVCDELGNQAQMDALCHSVNCGVKLIATVHGQTVAQVLQKSYIRKLVKLGAFEDVILLRSRKEPSAVEQVIEVGQLDL